MRGAERHLGTADISLIDPPLLNRDLISESHENIVGGGVSMNLVRVLGIEEVMLYVMVSDRSRGDKRLERCWITGDSGE